MQTETIYIINFLDMGFSPRKAMISIFFMALVFCCLNIMLVSRINNNILFIADIIIWIGLNIWFDKIRDGKLIQKDCNQKLTFHYFI